MIAAFYSSSIASFYLDPILLANSRTVLFLRAVEENGIVGHENGILRYRVLNFFVRRSKPNWVIILGD